MITNKWIFAIFILAFILLVPFFYLWKLVSRYDDANPLPVHYQVAIVLGAALWDGQPSPALKERCNLALRLYQKGQVDYLLLSGGLGKGSLTEAEGMKNYLTARGVPADHLLLEDRSSNTLENLKYSAAILKQTQFTKITIVTHDYHMYRALNYAKWAGIHADPSPVHSKVLFVPYHKARECLALIKQMVFHL
jgi:uncharacterized SAM-binding protein YcdF (DUF218 family)